LDGEGLVVAFGLDVGAVDEDEELAVEAVPAWGWP
jgi:hypothetical protein